jgi:esterase/lipase
MEVYIMSDIPVLILHGWSDTSASFKPLANFLRNNGRQVIDIWLA